MRLRTPLASSFETLIEDLLGAARRAAPAAGTSFSIDSLEAAWALKARSHGPAPPEGSGPSESRFDVYGSETIEAAHDVLLDAQRVAGELGLFAGASEDDIAALRRQFALRNHPDRVPPELRELATQRMMIANTLIDHHLAKLRRGGG